MFLSLVLTPFGANAVSEYGLALMGDDTFLRIQPGVETTTIVRVKNLGAQTDTYALSVDGVTWAEPDKEQISVGPGQTASVVLKLNPPEGDSEEAYVRLSAASMKSEIESTWDIYVSTNDQYRSGSATGFASFASGSGAGAIFAFAIIVSVLVIFRNRAKRAEYKGENIAGTGKARGLE